MSLFGGNNKESYKDKKSLVIYFSRADENYAVGFIDKGNTEYIAEFVQEYTRADLFKAEPLVPYSKDYITCIEEATKKKKQDFTRVELLTYDEGICVQCMHIGSYDDEWATVII